MDTAEKVRIADALLALVKTAQLRQAAMAKLTQNLTGIGDGRHQIDLLMDIGTAGHNFDKAVETALDIVAELAADEEVNSKVRILQ